MTRFCICLLWFCATALGAHAAENTLFMYRFAPELPFSEDYQVSTDGVILPVLQTKRGAILSFGMDGQFDLTVRLAKTPNAVVVRPLSAGIRAEINAEGFRIHLPRPMNLSVEVDGNLQNPLLVFANPKIDAPKMNDPKVKYFEGGKVYDVGEILLHDGESLYLDGGAVVRGVVRAVGANHVTIGGPGILDGGTRTNKINMLVLRECQNATLENFILLDPLGWSIHLSGSENIQMRNTRVVGWRANSDGLDIEYTKHVKVEGCFWRTNDDCIAIKAVYPPGIKGVPFEEMINPEFIGGHKVDRIEGDVVGDIDISRCVLWKDQSGQGFEVGFELRVDEIRGVRFHDNDMIHILGGGAFTIHDGDRARIEDLLIEDVRVEDTDRFVDFHVGLSIYSVDCPREYYRSNPKRVAVPAEHRPAAANNPYQWYVPAEADLAKYDAQRGLVRGVTFRNIQILKSPKTGSMMNGYNENRAISDVRFENVTIEGKPVLSAEDAGIRANAYVRNMKFRFSSAPINQ